LGKLYFEYLVKGPPNKSFQRTVWASASLQPTPPLNSSLVRRRNELFGGGGK